MPSYVLRPVVEGWGGGGGRREDRERRGYVNKVVDIKRTNKKSKSRIFDFLSFWFGGGGRWRGEQGRVDRGVGEGVGSGELKIYKD